MVSTIASAGGERGAKSPITEREDTVIREKIFVIMKNDEK